MISRKICLIGDFGVGKTSLVARFVNNTFSDRYLSTVGVRVDTKIVDIAPEQTRKLVVWDIAGQDKFTTTSLSYLRGASGYLLIADATRSQTLDTALSLHQTTQQLLGPVPCLLLLNKTDLSAEKEVDCTKLQQSDYQGPLMLETSALSGKGVEEAFLQLARSIG
jgi:small GTP-binding protein